MSEQKKPKTRAGNIAAGILISLIMLLSSSVLILLITLVWHYIRILV